MNPHKNTQAKFSLIMVQTGVYPAEYANRLYNMLRMNCSLPFNAYCFSDTPQDLWPDITPIPIPTVYKGWWNKPYVYSDLVPDGWIVYFDLDIIIRQDISAVISYALENTQEIACWADAISWMGEKFNSSCQIFKKGTMRHIFNEFLHQYPAIQDRAGGDQVWVGPQLKNILFLNEKFPNFVQSFKTHVLTQKNDTMYLNRHKFEESMIIDFHGPPKPHQLLHIPFIAEIWNKAGQYPKP